MPSIRMGFEPQKTLKYGSQNVTVPLEMTGFLNRRKKFWRYLFQSLDFLGLRCENCFMVTLFSIWKPLQ